MIALVSMAVSLFVAIIASFVDEAWTIPILVTGVGTGAVLAIVAAFRHRN